MPTLHLRDFTCAYDDLGSGVALLWIHGFPFHREMWAPQIEALRSEARVIAPDLRGFGASERTPGPYTMEQYADDLARLLDALEVESAVVGGLSMGGYVALALVRRHPDRVRALLLVDTRAEADTEEAREKRGATAALVREGGAPLWIDELLPQLLSEETLRERPEVVERLRRIMQAAHPDSIAAALAGMAGRPDSRDLLPRIRVPTVVIVGAHDAITPPEAAEATARAIPGARLVVIAGAGHVSSLERPEEFNRVAREFLRELRG